jgi:hypothetical protein
MITTTKTYEKPVCTIAQAKAWFGERGMDVSARDIKIRGQWALVKEDWSVEDNEVNCYNLASSSIFAEAWSGIKYTDSPFIPRNEATTIKALQAIDEEYAVYLEELEREHR